MPIRFVNTLAEKCPPQIGRAARIFAFFYNHFLSILTQKSPPKIIHFLLPEVCSAKPMQTIPGSYGGKQ